jgi:putative DNA methylase
MGARVMGIVAEGDRERVYLASTAEHETATREATPDWKPDVAMPDNPRWFSPPLYGLTTYGDLFTPRQLVALTTFSGLVGEALEQVRRDALAAGLTNDSKPLRDGGTGATAYAEAVAVYLGQVLSKITAYHCTLGIWRANMGKSGRAFGRQAIPMVWDFPECNPFAGAGGDWEGACRDGAKVLETFGREQKGHAHQAAAQEGGGAFDLPPLVSTDPPYYDNVGYADLSDFYYVWLRPTLRPIFPQLFATVAVPKAEELVATPYRHGGREKAEAFFLHGMTQVMHNLAGQGHPGFPATIYYELCQVFSVELL